MIFKGIKPRFKKGTERWENRNIAVADIEETREQEA